MTVAAVEKDGKYRVVQTVKTQKSARTMTVDPKSHKIYLPAAEFGPMPEKKPGEKFARPPVKKDTFVILVVGREPKEGK